MSLGASISAERVIWKPRALRAGNPVVVFCHGFLGTKESVFDGDVGRVASRLVAAGFAVASHDLGGGSTWGNDTAADTLAAELSTGLPAHGFESFHLWGVSMGAWVAHSCIRRGATPTSAVLMVPAVNGARLVAEGVFAAAIDTAWGGSFAAVEHYADPRRTAQDVVARVPLQVWYSTDDPTCTPEGVIEYCAKAGVDPLTLGAVGHSITGAPDRVDEMVDFLVAAEGR